MTYNPADYKAVEDKAKGMSKQNLEEYYANDKSKRHKKCCEILGMVLLVLFLIFVIGFLGYTIAESNMGYKVENNMEEISMEVCPTLGPGYVSGQALESSYAETRIVCTNMNSVPR